MEPTAPDASVTWIWSPAGFGPPTPTTAWVQDQGLLRGWGAFETMLAVDFDVPLWSRHWARLQHGARQLELPLPPEHVFRAALPQILGAASSTFPQSTTKPYYRLRLTVTSGEGPTWMHPGETPTCVLSVSPWSVPLPMAQQPGLRLLSYPHSFAPPMALRGCKHTSYLPWLMAARHAEFNGCGDAVLLDPSGFVIETTRRNLFVWRNEQLWTPPLSSGCLPGVMRGLLLEVAARLGIRVEEQPLTLADGLAADRVFLTSAVTVLQSVRQWDERSYSGSEWAGALQDLEHELHQALVP